MRILFISSGNSPQGLSIVVGAQAESLIQEGVDISFFPIKGKGTIGYMKNIPPLRKYLKQNSFDLVHAHYGLSAIVATLAGAKPLVVSLMGSDMNARFPFMHIIRFFNKRKWSLCIVKTEKQKEALESSLLVIPNGVDLTKFFPIEKPAALRNIRFDSGRTNILFLADPSRPEKNFSLAQKAIDLLNKNDIALHKIYNQKHTEIVYYLNAADLLLLTSLREGSPNVIKEAMACNCPIVSTDVGDVRWLFGNLEGHYIASFEPEDVADKIRLALGYGKRTNGRQRITELGLDSVSVAKRIIEVYRTVLDNEPNYRSEVESN